MFQRNPKEFLCHFVTVDNIQIHYYHLRQRSNSNNGLQVEIKAPPLKKAKTGAAISSAVIGGSTINISSAPLKPGVFGRKRHELDSPNLGGHLPHHPTSCYNLPLRRSEMAVVGKGNWTYSAYLLSDVRTSSPLKRSQPPQTGLHRC
ncbi:hypothetical protein AVEN_234312-1 [Araneus ventricosus]|uniref:Uncharacterized protein n=1 Tax=Araneus ventricosus TaxID=182803 RepID=A0A4Y2A8V9_ARAVE|nr:hypothetical protein AVEN_234312-1 [Araneus ventricosus]